jgi:hypothetical protein
MYIVTCLFMFHYTQSCTSCKLSPFLYFTTHRAVLQLHCHLF